MQVWAHWSPCPGGSRTVLDYEPDLRPRVAGIGDEDHRLLPPSSGDFLARVGKVWYVDGRGAADESTCGTLYKDGHRPGGDERSRPPRIFPAGISGKPGSGIRSATTFARDSGMDMPWYAPPFSLIVPSGLRMFTMGRLLRWPTS